MTATFGSMVTGQNTSQWQEQLSSGFDGCLSKGTLQDQDRCLQNLERKFNVMSGLKRLEFDSKRLEIEFKRLDSDSKRVGLESKRVEIEQKRSHREQTRFEREERSIQVLGQTIDILDPFSTTAGLATIIMIAAAGILQCCKRDALVPMVIVNFYFLLSLSVATVCAVYGFISVWNYFFSLFLCLIMATILVLHFRNDQTWGFVKEGHAYFNIFFSFLVMLAQILVVEVVTAKNQESVWDVGFQLLIVTMVLLGGIKLKFGAINFPRRMNPAVPCFP